MLHYTLEASERIEDLIEQDAAEIWADISPQVGDEGRWMKKLENIARDYLMSSRYCLMRLLHQRVLAGGQRVQGDPENWAQTICASQDHFQVPVGGKWVLFRDITLEHAQKLTPREHQDYIDYLLQIASTSQDADPEFARKIILRAWLDQESADSLAQSQLPEAILSDEKKAEKARKRYEKANKKQYGTLLTRQEALQLGHLLRFSLREIQWFLMRVFDVEDGLRMNHSADLIESYCFLMEKSWLDAQNLKDSYRRRAGDIPKEDRPHRGQNWTALVAGGLAEKIEGWKRYPDTCDEHFLSWMEQQAWGLDVPSRTARRIYRNLAVYAYKLSAVDQGKYASGKSFLPEEEELQDSILVSCLLPQEHGDVGTYLYENGALSLERCQAFVGELLRDNKEMSQAANPDRTKAWGGLLVREDGSISSSAGAINGRTRIQELLLGQAEVEKGDLLYLLWFLMNTVWYESPASDPDILCCRVYDLKDTASILLEAAGLPDFYPPHLMEQTMLLSIIYGGKEGINPIEVYVQLLETVRRPRNRKKA